MLRARRGQSQPSESAGLKGDVEFASGPYRVFEIEVDKAAGPCSVALGSQRDLAIEPSMLGTVLFSTISDEDLLSEGSVRVEAPHRIVKVRRLHSSSEPDWVTASARPHEHLDVVVDRCRPTLRLSRGWSPRELVEGQPVRWVGSSASVEIDPSVTVDRVRLAGVIGPSLGRGAKIVMAAGGAIVSAIPIDLEDGQRFDVTFDVGRALDTGSFDFLVQRPNPRFTQHDARLLNLLVKELEIR